MGIRGSLLTSLVIHVGLLFIASYLLPSLKKEVDTVRVNLSYVKVVEVPRETLTRKVQERKKAPERRKIRKIKSRNLPEREKRIKPEKDPVGKKVVEKEQKEIVTATQGEETEKKALPGKEGPLRKSLKQKRVVGAHPSKLETKAPRSTSKDPGSTVSPREGHGEEEASYQERYRRENLHIIREAILYHLRYPPIARRMGWEGTVLVRFTLLPDGSLEDVRVERGSGHRILDRNALRAVMLACGDFPRPERKVTLLVPIVYRLER